MRDDGEPGDELTYRIIGLAMRVHSVLRLGLLESVYEACLCHELEQASLPFRRQVLIPVHYNGTRLDAGFVADILVKDQALLELKAVERLLPIHEAQLMTYLRLTDCLVGLLINFNTVSLTDGIRRRIR